MQKEKIVSVLDTNIFISGLISPNGVPGQIIKSFRLSAFNLMTSIDQIVEIDTVLKRPSLKKFISSEEAREIVKFLKKKSKQIVVFSPKKMEWDFSDTKDHFLLDLIAEGKPDVLVTGDKKLRDLVEVCGVSFVTPVEFLTMIHA